MVGTRTQTNFASPDPVQFNLSWSPLPYANRDPRIVLYWILIYTSKGLMELSSVNETIFHGRHIGKVRTICVIQSTTFNPLTASVSSWNHPVSPTIKSMKLLRSTLPDISFYYISFYSIPNETMRPIHYPFDNRIFRFSVYPFVQYIIITPSTGCKNK